MTGELFGLGKCPALSEPAHVVLFVFGKSVGGFLVLRCRVGAECWSLWLEGSRRTVFHSDGLGGVVSIYGLSFEKQGGGKRL